MKKLLFLLLSAGLSLSQTSMTYAVSPTPSDSPILSPTLSPPSSPAISSDQKNINVLNELKDKIASRVAQLNLVQKKGTIGSIHSLSGTQITITDTLGNEQIIDVDELTKFSSPSAKSSFGLSDLTKGATVDILGLFNKQSKHILARFVTVTTLTKYVFGEIALIDKNNFAVSVISIDNSITPVDIETVTKIYMYTNGSLQKSGFSKLVVGKHIVAIGFPDKNNPEHIIASRIIIFPDAVPNPRIVIPQQALSPDTTIVPSTGSGKKLTPITH